MSIAKKKKKKKKKKKLKIKFRKSSNPVGIKPKRYI